MYLFGAGHGAAICDESLHFKIACKENGDPSGKPALARLDTDSANVAGGFWREPSMSNMRAILILEQGHENMIIPCSEMYKLGKGAR
eukprot:2314304-Pyramimonas_sp.AAC.1